MSNSTTPTFFKISLSQHVITFQYDMNLSNLQSCNPGPIRKENTTELPVMKTGSMF